MVSGPKLTVRLVLKVASTLRLTAIPLHDRVRYFPQPYQTRANLELMWAFYRLEDRLYTIHHTPYIMYHILYTIYYMPYGIWLGVRLASVVERFRLASCSSGWQASRNQSWQCRDLIKATPSVCVYLYLYIGSYTYAYIYI